MAWSEAAYLSKMDTAKEPNDLTAVMVNTARQNIAAAQSTIPNDYAVRQHGSLSEISICIQPLGDHRSSWGGDA